MIEIVRQGYCPRKETQIVVGMMTLGLGQEAVIGVGGAILLCSLGRDGFAVGLVNPDTLGHYQFVRSDTSGVYVLSEAVDQFWVNPGSRGQWGGFWARIPSEKNCESVFFHETQCGTLNPSSGYVFGLYRPSLLFGDTTNLAN